MPGFIYLQRTRMTKPKKPYRANFLRENTTDLFASFFKEIIFCNKLPYGCRLWILSTATHRQGKPQKTGVQARKFGVHPGQIFRWRKQAQSVLDKWLTKKG